MLDAVIARIESKFCTKSDQKYPIIDKTSHFRIFFGERFPRSQFSYTRNSAIADKPRDAFRDQSRSPNMAPFHMIGTVSY